MEKSAWKEQVINTRKGTNGSTIRQQKNERHDINAIPDNFQMFKEKYGEEAAREYVQHLNDDIKGRFGHVLEELEKEMTAAIKYFGSK